MGTVPCAPPCARFQMFSCDLTSPNPHGYAPRDHADPPGQNSKTGGCRFESCRPCTTPASAGVSAPLRRVSQTGGSPLVVAETLRKRVAPGRGRCGSAGRTCLRAGNTRRSSDCGTSAAFCASCVQCLGRAVESLLFCDAACDPDLGLATHLVAPDLRTYTSHDRLARGGSSSAGSATNQTDAAASPITRNRSGRTGLGARSSARSQQERRAARTHIWPQTRLKTRQDGGSTRAPFG